MSVNHLSWVRCYSLLIKKFCEVRFFRSAAFCQACCGPPLERGYRSREQLSSSPLPIICDCLIWGMSTISKPVLFPSGVGWMVPFPALRDTG